MSIKKGSLRRQLEGLAAFLPTFQAPGPPVGRFEMPPASPDPAAARFPHWSYRAAVWELVEFLEGSGWIDGNFDWPTWKLTPEAESLRDDPAALGRAGPEQLRMLLTTIVRQERYFEGELFNCFESGLFLRILRRADVLAKERGHTG